MRPTGSFIRWKSQSAVSKPQNGSDGLSQAETLSSESKAGDEFPHMLAHAIEEMLVD